MNALSNALSQIVKWLLASTIGAAFAQYFWSATKSYDDWRELDAPLAAANGNPFTISAFPTWWRSPGLAFSALMMMSMIFVPIFVPGSIRVVTVSGLMQPCNVSFPNVSMAYLATTTRGREVAKRALDDSPDDGWERWEPYMATTLTTALVNRVIVGGSYLPVPNPCHGGVCTYRINFTAPALKCSSDINATYNFSTNLPQTHTSSVWLPILNGTLENGYALTVATRDGVAPDMMNPPVAVRCNASRADYHVRVRHDNFSSHIDILDIPFSAPLSLQRDPLTLALGGLVLAIRDAFSGSVIFDSKHDGFAERPLSVGYSPLLSWVHNADNRSVLTWPDLTAALPELMRNVSLSLLSGQFPSMPGQTYMETNQTECSMTQLVYDYNSRRLLAIYAVAWAAAAVFFSLGFLFIWKNGEEHNLDFSHVVGQRHLVSYSQVPLIPEGSGSVLSASTWRDMPPLQQTHLDSVSYYSYSSDLPYS